VHTVCSCRGRVRSSARSAPRAIDKELGHIGGVHGPIYISIPITSLKVEGDVGTVGISGHAADALGDIVFVELPDVGSEYEKG